MLPAQPTAPAQSLGSEVGGCSCVCVEAWNAWLEGGPTPQHLHLVFLFSTTEDSLTPSTLLCTLSPQYPNPWPALPVVLETWPRWVGCLLWGGPLQAARQGNRMGTSPPTLGAPAANEAVDATCCIGGAGGVVPLITLPALDRQADEGASHQPQ